MMGTRAAAISFSFCPSFFFWGGGGGGGGVREELTFLGEKKV